MYDLTILRIVEVWNKGGKFLNSFANFLPLHCTSHTGTFPYMCSSLLTDLQKVMDTFVHY